MPMSIAGSERPGANGFTLVELLVVLAIMAFATLAVAPSLQRLVAPRPPRPVAEELLDALSRSRDEAIQKRRSFRGVIDPANRAWLDSAGNLLYQAGADATIEAASGASAEPVPCTIRPDGSGCNLSLKVMQNEQEWRLKVDPITGRIHLLRVVTP